MTQKEPTVLTIILNYKTADMTLESAAAARVAMQGIAGGIVIVDNDSQDGSYEKITDHVRAHGWDADDHVRVLRSEHNGGFGAGNNLGIRAGLPDGSEPDFVYVLNSDAFPEPDAIRALLDYMQASPGTGFAGSYIEGPDGDTHQSNFRFHTIASEFERAIRFGPVSRILKNYRVSMEIPSKPTAVDWVAGASLLMRRSVLDEIGLFDEDFFLYYEEVDLCLRASRAGWSIDFVPASRVVHIGSVSTGMKVWKTVPPYWYDSRWLYFSKNFGVGYAACATLAHLLGGSLHYLRCLLTGKERGVNSGYLGTMLRHDLRALMQRPASSSSRSQERRGTVS